MRKVREEKTDLTDGAATLGVVVMIATGPCPARDGTRDQGAALKAYAQLAWLA